MIEFGYDIFSGQEIDQARIEKAVQRVRQSGVERFFFDTEVFHAYHQRNCEQLYCIIAVEGDKTLGFCYAGLRYGVLRVGYSSPFAQLYLLDGGSESFCRIAEAVNALADRLGTETVITLPPSIYDGQTPLKVGALLDSGYHLFYAHVSHYFDLREIQTMEAFVAQRPHSYRKNWKRAMQSKLMFLASKEDRKLLRRAYAVIEQNREEKNYPLSMPWDQIEAIADMEGAKIGAFVVTTPEGVDIAAAIVFCVSSRVHQVVYWGNLEEYAALRPMEFLSYHLVMHYRELGADCLDIGPSTAEGKMSHGLVRFKETIGCRSDLKMVLHRPLDSHCHEVF